MVANLEELVDMETFTTKSKAMGIQGNYIRLHHTYSSYTKNWLP